MSRGGGRLASVLNGNAALVEERWPVEPFRGTKGRESRRARLQRTEEIYETLAFAASTTLAKPAASRTARSASILRLTSTPARLRPAMNWL